MRIIQYQTVVDAVAALCDKAAFDLPSDVEQALVSAHVREESPLGKTILKACLDNAGIARTKRLAICQDTGFAVYFVEMGVDCRIDGGLLVAAINDGTEIGYRDGYLRKSIVTDPLYDRKNTTTNTPAVVHLEIVAGDTLTVTLAPKGGGSENMSGVAMLKPADGEDGVVDFVVKTVVNAGGNPCPPVVVGVGIGGTFEKCAYLAKKSLLRDIGSVHADPRYALLEKKILDRVNASGVGPQGLGGTVTAIAVHIETYPCHIASMPVAVNINCHAARHASVTL